MSSFGDRVHVKNNLSNVLCSCELSQCIDGVAYWIHHSWQWLYLACSTLIVKFKCAKWLGACSELKLSFSHIKWVINMCNMWIHLLRHRRPPMRRQTQKSVISGGSLLLYRLKSTKARFVIICEEFVPVYIGNPGKNKNTDLRLSLLQGAADWLQQSLQTRSR